MYIAPTECQATLKHSSGSVCLQVQQFGLQYHILHKS